MALHVAGVKVTPRGSLQDLMLNRFMSDQLAAKMIETRFLQMSAQKEGQDDWNQNLNRLFKDYVQTITGGEVKEDKREDELIRYFTDVVSKTPLRARREEGTLIVEGTEELL
jgi:hypothetical protein